MSERQEESSSATLESLVRLGRDAARPPTRQELDAGLDIVRVRLGRARIRRQWSKRVAVVMVLMALPLAWVQGKTWLMPAPSELAYEVRGGSLLEGGYLRESGGEGVSVSFEEGSRFVLSSGSRGRLRAVSDERARVGIEHGSARVKVTPATGRTWEVEAGPFLVTVEGTEFDVSWDPAQERFDLRLQHGRVVVSGPVSGGELTLNAGQRLSVDLAEARTLITENLTDAGAGAPESLPSPTSASSDVTSWEHQADPNITHTRDEDATAKRTPDDTTAVRPTPGGQNAVESRSVSARRQWSKDVAKGRWDAILADADRIGIATALNSASSEDLFALANAARYRRRAALAHDALQAIRVRFPQSPRALDAVFLLGRVQEARSGGLTRAIGWYDEYLAKAPNGAYASEALGRKMTIVRRTSGAKLALPIAKDYLRRFPDGSHARAARALLDER